MPDDVRPSTCGVFVLGSNGKSAEKMLESSGWRELADQDESLEKMIVFFLEPEDGKWKTSEKYGDPAGDVAYINAVYLCACERLHYCVHEAKNYLYGEDDGGTMAHMAAMANPAIYAGVATINATDVNQEYLDACSTDRCTNLLGMLDETGTINILKGEIPLPVLLIEGEGSTEHILQHWCRANEVEKVAHVLAPGIIEYRRSKNTSYPCNQDKRAYRVRIMDTSVADLSPKFIWQEFLSRHRRWMGDPGGDLRLTFDPVKDAGMEYHAEEIGGWQREWYVYVPENVREKPETPVPLVFAMHGYSCSGEIYAGNSEWYRVACERGFIVVHPSAIPMTMNFESQATSARNTPLPGWNVGGIIPNGPDEFEFFRTMLNRICAVYPVDRSRVYITGHSHGSMMTQALALGMPEMFAAAAPCSGVIFEYVYDAFLNVPELWKKDIPIPVWMFAGKREEWLIDAMPTAENATGKTLKIWHKRNNLAGEAEEMFQTGWQIHAKRWNDLTYRRTEDDAPMVKYSSINDFPHATTPEMSFRIWDEFFAHWSRECGTCRYS